MGAEVPMAPMLPMPLDLPVRHLKKNSYRYIIEMDNTLPPLFTSFMAHVWKV